MHCLTKMSKYPLLSVWTLGSLGKLTTSTGKCSAVFFSLSPAMHVAGAPSFDHLRDPKGGRNDSNNNHSRQAKQRRRPSKSHCPGRLIQSYLPATPNLATTASMCAGCSISNELRTSSLCTPANQNWCRSTMICGELEIQRRSTGRPALLILNEAIQPFR